ncbi:MAG: N-6 DNA methylase [Anaerolineae bacterium]|nr:N-6 DNA methylase [Anaerolineae bacterium]
MASRTTIFTTIRTEGALLPADLLQRISEGTTIDGLTAESYHRPGEKLNEAINRSWNALQGAWASFKTAQERLPENDLGTTITRERWLLPLFRELDYGRLPTAQAVEIDGRSYPISHGWQNVPIHLVSYKVDLDKRTARVAGASAASPHSLLQVFLNRSQGNLWGFLSNGYYLRILRDNATLTRQAYVEFDLQAMMEGEVYSDFVLLWLLGHQSRVEGERPADCWLEKWMKVAENEGTRALDDLRNGVEQAITALGLGFIEHPANHALRDQLTSGGLDKQDYYRQLLRLVYRLLFLFVAEDRDLLLNPQADETAKKRYVKYYSTQRLRHMAEKFKGTRHPDLYEGLRLVMRLLSGDQNGAGAGLGIIPLGSFLFSDEAVPAIIDCQISNQHLLAAIRALSLTYDQKAKVYRTVDYKNLGPEELGSIYESLLELHPQINVDARTFALATAGGNERKTTGSYYTPTSLINALLDSALDPVLNEAAKQGTRAILDLKVCDPACGSGHFLIAAAGRMAKKLAEVRTGEEEPPPAAIQEAKRDIIGHCIYGVDINPMAVELCKVNLWMEALEPGKPLSFLDHRILWGNSLLGTTPRLMSEGIPDDAFQPIEGDDRTFTAGLRRQNKREQGQKLYSGQMILPMGSFAPSGITWFTEDMHELDEIGDDTLKEVREKESAYQRLVRSESYQRTKLLADAWCSAFVWEKRPDVPSVMTQGLYLTLEARTDSQEMIPVRRMVEKIANHYKFFHWHIAFPDVFTSNIYIEAQNPQMEWDGGFDCVLGNPPWERIKIQEKEFFAEKRPDIAAAPNAAARRRMIEALADEDPDLLAEFAAELRRAEGESHFVRQSGRYPLCGRGDVNTYTIFAESSRHIINGYGHVGMIVPSGIATDDTTKLFFQDLMQTHSLASIYDFENREGLFPAVDSRMKFCLLTMTGWERPTRKGAEFVFFALNVGHLQDEWRLFTLSAEDIALLNPNTGTTATFRSQRDAEITKAIYRRVPVLIQEEPLKNAWGIRFSTMFHMSNDSHLFHTPEQLAAEGFELKGNWFVHSDEVYLPLYEAKMFDTYDHRYAEVVISETAQIRQGQPRVFNYEEHNSPLKLPMPRYWVQDSDVRDQVEKYYLAYRRVTSPTNATSFQPCILPFSGAGDSVFIMRVDANQASLESNLASFVFDYTVRQKVGGVNLNFFIVQQLPVIPPHTYIPNLLNFILPHVLELTYTAWDLQAFAQDVGYEGPPFIWDEERRFLMRCELDALYFHLYQIARDDVDYIMETFPIVKRKDEAAFGEYATKRVILEMYDQMASLPKIAVPHPKGLDVEYLVPDVAQFTTWLNPPPADPGVAHPPRMES